MSAPRRVVDERGQAVVASECGMEELHLRHHRFVYRGYCITFYTRLVVMPNHDWDRPAPGELWRVQRLINTLDVEDGSDALSAAWLVEHGLGETDDLEPVRTPPRGAAAAAAVPQRRTGGRGRRRQRSTRCRGRRASPSGSRRTAVRGWRRTGPVGRALAIVARAEADGTWERLKICPADDCHWAFYDFSRNHSRTWCSMSMCGNRAKARTYRSKASA